MSTILQTPGNLNVTSKFGNIEERKAAGLDGTSQYEKIDEYQEKIKDFRLPSYGPEAAVMGLVSEIGEIAAVFQKLMRGDYDLDVAVTKLRAELGDALWHIAAIASDNEWKVSDLLQDNVDKLESRKLRNAMMGSGDER